MKFEFNDGFLLAGGKVIAEINALEEKAIDTLFDSKMSAGVSRIISEKNELQLKYDRLLKDYELARHECKQKTEHIEKLEEEHESLLKKISKLHEEQAGFDNAYSVLKDEICKKDVCIKELEEKQENLLRELENLRGEKTYVLEMWKNSENKLVAIKDIIYGD